MAVKRVFGTPRKVGLYTRFKNRLLSLTETKHSPMSVTHKEAMKWFKHRKAGYEELVSAVTPYLNQDSIIFDVGANVGYFSFMLAKKIDFNGSIYLFEPLPNLAKLCEETFQGTSYETKVFNYGLSNEDSEQDIFVSSNGNIGWNTLVQSKASEDMEKVRIQLKEFENCQLDAIPTFIKIDVEGAEYLVLRGMLDSFKKWAHLPVILCEVGWGNSHPNWDEEIEVFKQLREIGYSICDLNGLEIDETSLTSTTDVLMIPKKP